MLEVKILPTFESMQIVSFTALVQRGISCQETASMRAEVKSRCVRALSRLCCESFIHSSLRTDHKFLQNLLPERQFLANPDSRASCDIKLGLLVLCTFAVEVALTYTSANAPTTLTSDPENSGRMAQDHYRPRKGKRRDNDISRDRRQTRDDRRFEGDRGPKYAMNDGKFLLHPSPFTATH